MDESRVFVTIKSSGFPVFVLQPAGQRLTGLAVQHRNNLVARMQITSDNQHGSAPLLGTLGRDITKLTAAKEPTPLSHHCPQRRKTPVRACPERSEGTPALQQRLS